MDIMEILKIKTPQTINTFTRNYTVQLSQEDEQCHHVNITKGLGFNYIPIVQLFSVRRAPRSYIHS